MSWKNTVKERSWKDTIQPTQPDAFAQPPIERKPQYGPSELETFGTSYGQGLTLENLDELKAILESGQFSGPQYQRAVAKEREIQALGEEQNPLSSIFGRTAGYATGALAGGAALGGTAARRLGLDVLMGAGQGFGASESLENAPSSTAMGIGASLIVPGVAAGIKKVGPKAVELGNQALFRVDPEVTQTLMRKPDYLDQVSTVPELAERYATDLTSKKKTVSDLRGQSFETLGVKPFQNKRQVEAELEKLPSEFGIGKATEQYPAAQAILKEIENARQGLNAAQSQAEIKNILQRLDETANFATPSGSQINAVRKRIRGAFDTALKEENPAYRAAMEPLASETRKLRSGIKAGAVEAQGQNYRPTDLSSTKFETLIRNLQNEKQSKAKETVEAVSPGILDELNKIRLERKATGGTTTGARNTLIGTAGVTGLNTLLGDPISPMIAATIGAALGGVIDVRGRSIGSAIAKNFGRISQKSQKTLQRVAPLFQGANQTGVHEFLLTIDPDYQEAIEEVSQ